jgi:hypothetical protein
MGKKICLIAVAAFFAAFTCFAQKIYSLGEEIPLLNEAMKLKIAVENNSKGMQVVLILENTGKAEVNWAIVGAAKPKNSEVIIEIDGKKDVAPIGEKLESDIDFKSYQAGTIGLLTTHATSPGGKTTKSFLFSDPKKGAEIILKIRQLVSGGILPESLFPKEGIAVKIM